MANTYPAVQTRWFDVLSHLSGFLYEKHKQSFKLFQYFLALKIVAPLVFADGIQWPHSITAVIVFSSLFIAALPRFFPFSLWAVFGVAFYQVWITWPFTINHSVLELVIILLICLMQNDENHESKISCAELIKILMLSVWFFSGLHKLVDGYYLNAEFFAQEALANDTTLGQHLHQLLVFFSKNPLPTGLSCCVNGAFLLSKMQAAILLMLSWLTVVAEMVLPLMYFHTRTRLFAIIGLFVGQGLIGYLSGEIDFAFSAYAILFLFVPRFAPVAFLALAGYFLVAEPWL